MPTTTALDLDIPPGFDAGEIVILLASYNGARHIETQLNSIARQSYTNWRLIVSDDGSTDGTVDLVARFSATQRPDQVMQIAGPRRGATQNFLHLIEQAPDGVMLAFADQDDEWFPDKLARAAAALSSCSGPAHYAARTIVADATLGPITETRYFTRSLTFRNALVQACMAGNTSVFNPAAAAILKQSANAARVANIESHDWWAYQVTTGIGATMIHDAKPALLYRQHSNAEMGRNDTPGAMVRRLGKLFAGEYGGWLAANCAALTPIAHLLTTENQLLLKRFIAAVEHRGPVAAAKLRRMGIYRQTKVGTAALFSAAALGRL
ncbi:glycosyltransferase [Paracoccus sp. 11-3]|uniref:Glycosyltransferase n=1 Tax=Paracoccus amoyensis TaxID=2760093 RepID=A0A926G8F8_9RHOB|nr:glycosyltransferase [Paracoccus amoyensis]MBC9246408.1 glycosyltransferase [Paracoccus amoyensis]